MKRKGRFVPDDLPEALAGGVRSPKIRSARTVADGVDEHTLQCAVARFLDLALGPLPDCLWFAVPNGGHRNKLTAAKLKAEGVKPGVADIIILWRGRFIAIELKKSANKERGIRKTYQSSEQKEWEDEVEECGGLYTVCRTIEEVEDFLRSLQIPLKASTQGARY